MQVAVIGTWPECTFFSGMRRQIVDECQTDYITRQGTNCWRHRLASKEEGVSLSRGVISRSQNEWSARLRRVRRYASLPKHRYNQWQHVAKHAYNSHQLHVSPTRHSVLDPATRHYRLKRAERNHCYVTYPSD